MRSIESVGAPLVFRVAGADALYPWPEPDAAAVRVRTLATALTGMQKEALVRNSITGDVWRMVCDEGADLMGTDLAPFPLAFFTTGVVLSYMGEIEALARQRGIEVHELALVQDHFYTMEGSALKGTMVGGALPVELSVAFDCDAGAAVLGSLLSDAVVASPANGLLREALTSLFSLTHNRTTAPVQRVAARTGNPPADPGPAFETAMPVSPEGFADGIIVKLAPAERAKDEGIAGSGLRADQKRTIHVRGVARRRGDGLKEVGVRLLQPRSSHFRFLGDEAPRFGGLGRAPGALDYLSAGIAFCYLTQLSRFAHITKLKLDRYSAVQDTAFSLPGASGGTGKRGTAAPVETHVHIAAAHSLAEIQNLIVMGEQTCFLHAACRTPLKTKIRLTER